MSATHRVVFAKERVLFALQISLRCLEEYNLNEQDCTQLILAKDLSGRCHEPVTLADGCHFINQITSLNGQRTWNQRPI